MASAGKLVKLDNGLQTVEFTSDGTFNLGDAFEAFVSCWILEVSGTFVASLVLRKKIHGSPVTDANALTTWYEDFAVSSTLVAAGTTVAADNTTRLLKVYTDGCDLILDCDWTSGKMVVGCRPLGG